MFTIVDHHGNNHNSITEPVRVIHKDQESISAFCLNNVNPGLISLATPREVQEMDIALLLESPHWMEDECELDILNLTKDSDLLPSSNFLVIQAASDKYVIVFLDCALNNNCIEIFEFLYSRPIGAY